MRPGVLASSDTVRSHSLDTRAVKAAAGATRLSELGPRNTAFLDAQDLLNPAVLPILLRRGVEDGIALWLVTATTPTEAAALEDAFPGLVAPLGPPNSAGSTLYGVTPKALLAATPPVVAPESLQGMDVTRLPRGLRDQLTATGVQTTRRSLWSRAVRHPQFALYLIVFIYSALRVLPVSFVSQFHGSLVVFWTIDLVSAVPYTWGVLALIFGTTWRYRMAGGVTTAVTFVAPYVYFWHHGQDYPTYVPVVIGALTVGTFLIELSGYLKERRLEDQYQGLFPAP